MKIAVATKDGKRLSPYFGGRSRFKIFRIKDGRIVDRYLLENVSDSDSNSQESKDPCGRKSNLFQNNMDEIEDCEVIITRRMGRYIWDKFGHMGIEVVFTKEKDAEENIRNYLSGEIFRKQRTRR
jgi:predicted Fe-Mo cluster-binding NifX family protein